MSKITRRRLLQTTSAVALMAQLPSPAKAFGRRAGSVASASPPSPPVITSSTIANGTTGTFFSYNITATNSPTSYGASGLPSPLTVNTGTGLISGTPTTVATTSATISATNAGGTGTSPLTITISAPSTTGTTAQAAALLADASHRIQTCGVATLFLPPWDQNTPGAQYSSQGTLAAGSFPTTMTLVQDGAVAGGVPTQSFGWVFRPGDMPAGHVPVFTGPGSVVWGFSAGLWTYWPDGSLRWAAFALMPPTGFAPALNSTTTITISDGGAGTWPTSSRTLAELYAQNLIVNGIAPVSFPTPPHNARSANMYALLNGDSNQYYAVKDLDGAAGARWTIKTKMQATTTANGTPDPQYVVTHRIFAMNTPTGGLAGFRWFGEIRNPFYNDSTGAKLYQVFEPPNTGTPSAGLNWQTVGPGGSGTVNNPAWLPFNTTNYFNGAKSFTGAITGDVLTVTGGSPPVGYLVVGSIVTGSYNSGTGLLTISGATKPPIPMIDGYFIWPDGSVNHTTQYNVVSSTEPDGASGYRGTYSTPTPPASSFGPTSILFSIPIALANNGDGLNDGNTLTGQYSILYQLSVAGGDAPGQRGTYKLSGSVSTPITAEPMTFYSAYYGYSNPINNFFSGATGSNGYPNVNIVPCVITGSDLPPVDTGHLLGGTSPVTGASGSVIFAQGGLGTVLQAGETSYISVNTIYTGPGIGTCTPVPALPPFGRFNMATAQGRYNFFQGTGSVAAETTLRVQINQAYWNSTGTFLPMDMSVNGSTLPETPWQYQWNPYTVGHVRIGDIDAGGPPVELGLMSTICGWDFYKQSLLTEIENRAFGLSPGTIPCDFKSGDSGTFDRLLNMLGIGPTYSGLPAPSLSPYVTPLCGPGGSWSNGTGYSNVSPPGCVGSGLNNPTHEPDLCQWAYMRFGELQFFDFMCEWAQLNTGSQPNAIGPGQSKTAPPYPYEAYGIVIAGGQFRGTGWATRDLCKCAFWCSHDPTSNPSNPVFSDGSDLQGYLIAHADQQTAYAIAMIDGDDAGLWGSQAGADYVKASGMWSPKSGDGITGMQMWQSAYTAGGMMPSALRGEPKAIDFIKRWMNFVDRIANNTLLKGTSANAYIYHYTLGASQHIQFPGTLSGGPGRGGGGFPAMERDEQLCAYQAMFQDGGPGNQIIWVPNTSDGTTITGNAFSMEPRLSSNWHGTGGVPNNGDFLFAFGNAQGALTTPIVPSALTQDGGPYYVVNLTNTGIGTSGNIRWTFNLSATLGGSPIPITDSSTGNGLGTLDAIFHSAVPSTDEVVSNAYICQMRNTVNWIHAIGTGQTTNPNRNANAFAGFT
jgi:hypothetical protein